jgi:3-hydroxyisobutyrate dehydrogenase
MDETIAFLGAGTMGAPMALNLVQSGYPVRVWNRTSARAKPLAERGVAVTDTAAEAMRDATVLITMLYDGPSVEEALGGSLAELRDGAIWLQMTTVGAEAGRSLQEIADQAGVPMIDAPVLGTRTPAEEGKLTVLASGPDQLRERAAPIFDAIGRRTLWIDGPLGGQRLKLVVNSWILAVTEAVAEAIRLADGLGVDPALFTDAISGTANDLPYAQLKANAIRSHDFTPSFALHNAAKDATLILVAAVEAGVDMSVIEVVRDRLRRAGNAGHGDKDISAIALA